MYATLNMLTMSNKLNTLTMSNKLNTLTMSNTLNTLTMSNKLNTLTLSNVFEILHRVCEMERSNRSSSSQLASREIILILEKSLNLHLIQFDAECKQSNGEEISYHFDFNQI